MFFRNLFRIALLFISLAWLNQYCTSPARSEEFDKMDWLAGRWENEKDNVKTIEIWQRNSSNSYAVKGFMLEGADTIFTENIAVKPAAGCINYEVSITGQNQDRPVSFRLTQNTGKQLEFKNLKHDFPQLIRYTALAPDSVLVELAGTLKDKPVKEQYTLIKR
jgi:hypothetical protein